MPYCVLPNIRRATSWSGGAAKALLVSQAISPRLLDAVMKRIGFEIHYTNELKSEDAPDNLFAPIENHDIIEGSFATGRIPEASTPAPITLYDQAKRHRWGRRWEYLLSCKRGCKEVDVLNGRGSIRRERCSKVSVEGKHDS
jgi:hypothetical protein